MDRPRAIYYLKITRLYIYKEILGLMMYMNRIEKNDHANSGWVIMDQRKSVSSKIYTLIAISSTVLELYGISNTFHTFTWRFALVLLFSAFAMVVAISKRKAIIRREASAFIPFFISILLSFMSNMILGSEGFELRFIRFAIYMFFAVFLSGEYFDGDFALKIYRAIVWVATIVLLLQVAFARLYGRPFPGYLSFLPFRSEIFANTTVGVNYINRMYSIFEEPGYYGIFVGPYICICLLTGKIRAIELVFISISLLLSTSTSNMGVLAFLLVSFVIFVRTDSIRKSRLYILKALVLISGLIAIYYFMKSAQYQFVVRRLENGVSLQNRLVGYQSMDEFWHGNFLNILFGNAMESVVVSGYATMLMTFGVIGTICYFYGYLKWFRLTDRIGKYLLIFFLFINIGNVEFLGNASSMLIVYPFVIWYAKKKELGEKAYAAE